MSTYYYPKTQKTRMRQTQRRAMAEGKPKPVTSWAGIVRRWEGFLAIDLAELRRMSHGDNRRGLVESSIDLDRRMIAWAKSGGVSIGDYPEGATA